MGSSEETTSTFASLDFELTRLRVGFLDSAAAAVVDDADLARLMFTFDELGSGAGGKVNGEGTGIAI